MVRHLCVLKYGFTTVTQVNRNYRMSPIHCATLYYARRNIIILPRLLDLVYRKMACTETRWLLVGGRLFLYDSERVDPISALASTCRRWLRIPTTERSWVYLLLYTTVNRTQDLTRHPHDAMRFDQRAPLSGPCSVWCMRSVNVHDSEAAHRAS